MPEIISTTCSKLLKPLVTNQAFAFQGVQFSYTDQKLFQGLHVAIEEKSFVVIFGPNGGGKTTFIKLLLGFLQPDQGTISLLGDKPHKTRHKAGYVPQIAHLDREYPMSALEVVKTGLLHKKSFLGWGKELHQLALDALAIVGLEHLAPQHFGSLSGGEAQRVLIARAIVDNPAILVLDEPTSSLDQQSERTILALLKTLQAKMTILMVTHDLGSILSYADKLLCIHKEVCELSKDAVCQHYGLGLYHTPMRG